MSENLNIISAVLIILSGVPYIIGTIKRKTRPNIVSWFTWTILISIGAFAALDANEVNTAIIGFADAAQVGLILLLGLRYGYAKLSLFDGICQLGALIGLLLWLIFNNPTIAIIASISIDLIAALPTYRHAWLKPAEEAWLTFAITAVGAAFGLASLTSFTINSLAYPVYLLLLSSTLSTTILISRKRKAVPFFG